MGDGAEGIHIFEIIRAFRNMGHEVRVVGPVGENKGMQDSSLGKIKAFIPKMGFEFLEIAYNVYGFISLYKAVRAFRPDFIYDRYITFNASPILVGRHFDIPVIEEIDAPLALERSTQKDETLNLKKTAHWFEKWICANSTKSLVVSTPLADYFESKAVPAEQMMVMPNGVDQEKFSPRPKSEALLSEMGIKPGEVVVGFSGILRPWHGIDSLIDAVAKATTTETPIFLLIVGDGPIRKELEDKIIRAGLQDHYKITGLLTHEQVPSYVNLFDIAVCPKATFYASPMKLIEYMSLGKVVAVPDAKNFLDIVDPDLNGLCFKEGDIKSMAEVIRKLCNDEAQRKEFGANARSKVERRLNWEWNAREVCRLAAS